MPEGSSAPPCCLCRCLVSHSGWYRGADLVPQQSDEGSLSLSRWPNPYRTAAAVRVKHRDTGTAATHQPRGAPLPLPFLRASRRGKDRNSAIGRSRVICHSSTALGSSVILRGWIKSKRRSSPRQQENLLVIRRFVLNAREGIDTSARSHKSAFLWTQKLEAHNESRTRVHFFHSLSHFFFPHVFFPKPSEKKASLCAAQGVKGQIPTLIFGGAPEARAFTLPPNLPPDRWPRSSCNGVGRNKGAGKKHDPPV